MFAINRGAVVRVGRPPLGLARRARSVRSILAALALAWIALCPPALAQGSRPPVNALDTLARWTQDYRRMGPNLGVEADAELTPALDELRLRFTGIEVDENRAMLLLADLASIARHGSEPSIAAGSYVADSREAGVRQAALSVLRTAFDSPPGEGRAGWLATTVLAREHEQTVARRIAVAEALIGRHFPATLLPLCVAGSSPHRGLREAAVLALSGWQSDSVDRFLCGLTRQAVEQPGFLSPEPLATHFASRKLPADNPVAVELAGVLGQSTISTDWRRTVRHLPLLRALPMDLAAPQLIETLSIWSKRGEAGVSSRRVEAAIVAELETRSGKRLGMSVERWAFWWRASRSAGPSVPRPAEATTRAEFFGLHPWSDRVLFVIDRSGSMAEPFGTSDASRYEEALRQLRLLLEQLGPRTQFGLILFSDRTHRWQDRLRPANRAGIDAGLQWARSLKPAGGTFLRPAIERALELDAAGRPRLDRLEADTVIVLCDGATAEGSAWVAPLLGAVGDETCVRFDCVQIGRGGNGTLESLAEASGGQFTRVDP